MKNKLLVFFWCLVLVACCLSAFSQTLSVRDIMREPSLAGMRVEGERLSPDGKKVVFLWNAEGKEPKDLYLWNGTGEAVKILSPRDLLNPNLPQPPEGKLNYGVTVRDDFAKARENQLGGFEWSPDSKRLLFTQNGDLYLLNVAGIGSQRLQQRWQTYELAMQRRIDLIPIIVDLCKKSGIQEQEIFGKIADARAKLISEINETTIKTEQQQQKVIELNISFGQMIGRLLYLQESYPQLRSNQNFLKLQDELSGTENRLNVARIDYEDDVEKFSSKPKRLTKTQSPEFFARWLDDKRIIFLQNGNIFTVDIEQFSLIQLSKEANPTAFISVGNVTTSKDGRMVAYVVSDTSKQRGLVVPNYLDEFTAGPLFRRGWSDQRILVVPTDGSRDNAFEIKLPKSEGVSYFRAVKWAADNQSLIIDRNDKDTKRRQLYYVHNVGSKAEKTILLTDETDEKWIAPLSSLVEPNPKDNSQILFASEKDGSNHLYLATLERAKANPNPTGEIRQENPTDAGFTDNVKIEQLTKGKFEIDWAKWTNGDKFIFSSTEKTPAEREFYEFDLRQKKYVEAISDKGGMKISPQISENTIDRPVLLYSFSQWNQPTELKVSEVCTGCRGVNMPVQITKTTPDAFKKVAWVEPKFVDIPSRDGKPIKSKIYLPSNFNQDRAKRTFPMVIFVHGAGYLQNTINGWNNYFREYMFNHILTQKGYVILDIDYRGSAGYGRDWRTDVYDFLGGKDYEDHLDAIDFMVKNYAVDAKKIGAYGGSYGGFMAEMLAFRTDKITCAAALRPVADWKNYYASSPVYTAQRLGFPEKNPEGYKRSSPISYADGLNKPLLILHGMVDDNVHVQDSMQLIEKLMRLEKTQYFEAMLYPAENHGFTRPSSWTDEYERILSFFEKHLK